MIDQISSRLARFTAVFGPLSVSAFGQSVDEMQKKAIPFLEVTQAEDGSWTSPQSIGISGLVTESLLVSEKSVEVPVVQKALVFNSRSQNCESPHNQWAFAGKVNDGGFIYTPVNGGNSKACETENGGHKSYGLMTYAG